MRFLLNPTTQRPTTQGIQNKGRAATKKSSVSRILVQPQALVSKTKTAATKASASNRKTTSVVQSWGQQCSPNCGCVVRFEATRDPETNQFTSATYHAKSVVLSQIKSNVENGRVKLEPAMTLRTNRPMFKECSCKSLHALASKVTDYLPNKNAIALSSSMEFAGVRSSPAFRHTALEKQGLSTSHTHCFDLVEEALTAMIKGHMLKARPQVSLKEVYAAAASSPFRHSEWNNTEAPEENSAFRLLDLSSLSILQPTRRMSALSMLDGMHPTYSPFFGNHHRDSSEYENTTRQTAKTSKKDDAAISKKLDWVTYVDELNERFGEMQSSA